MAARINLDAPLKTFDGESLKADLSINDVLTAVNVAIAAADLPAEKLKQLESKIEKALEGKKKDFTLRTVLFALASAGIDGTAAEREHLFVAAVSCVGHSELELTSAEQVAAIKSAVGKVYRSALVNTQVCMLLEGKDPFAAPPPPAEKKAD